MAGSGISRRTLLERAGLAGAGVLLAQIPGFLSGKGWLEDAVAQSADEVRETLDALVAFVVPGPDPYSVAQGQSTKEPGGIDAGGTDLLIELLDRFVQFPVGNLPASGGVAQLLNGYALQVNPAAAGGAFVSPFARLEFDEKIEVFRRFEQETEGSELRFVSGILIGAVGFLSYTEGTALDRSTRQLTRTPTGWTLSRYDGVAEGRRELKGYWRGRRKVRTAKQYRVHR
ncbi:MAG TPA: hypothetical protein VF712_07255 [Thermoleophilaceae bacterium]|jgi:hypothetical protein